MQVLANFPDCRTSIKLNYSSFIFVEQSGFTRTELGKLSPVLLTIALRKAQKNAAIRSSVPENGVLAAG